MNYLLAGWLRFAGKLAVIFICPNCLHEGHMSRYLTSVVSSSSAALRSLLLISVAINKTLDMTIISKIILMILIPNCLKNNDYDFDFRLIFNA